MKTTDSSENEHNQPTTSTASPRFLVIHSTEERSISSLSPFVIEKVLTAMAGVPKSIKQLRSGDLLVEYTNKKHIECLLRLKQFHDLKVTVSLHGSLNTCRGWSGGAMVLGKLPVPGRPTILMTVGQGPIALAVGAGGGGLDIFTLIYPFSSFSLTLGDGPI